MSDTTTTTAAPDKAAIISRIEKLLRLSKSDNQHEAELAMHHVSQLMSDHQIAFSDLELNKAKTSNVVEQVMVVPGFGKVCIWAVTLAASCARLFDAQIVYHSGRHMQKLQITWIGLPTDLDAARALYLHLLEVKHRAADIARRDFCRDRGIIATPPVSRRFNNEFGHGFQQGIASQVTLAIKARRDAVAASSCTGRALVIAKDQLVSDYLRGRRFGRTQPTPVRRSDAYSAGKAVGASASLASGRISG